MQPLRLSVSTIQDFKACSLRHLYRKEYGLQPIKEKDSVRIGKIWHRCHEILEMIPQGRCPDCFKEEELQPDCYLCQGTGQLPVDLMDAVMQYLNVTYAEVPENKTHDQWATERIIILYSLSGYRWLFPDMHQRFRPMANEVWFELPVFNPKTGKKLSKAVEVGKIDGIIQDTETDLYYIKERKSTGWTIEGTKYWDKLKIDPQITSYLRAARMYQIAGRLEKFGIMRDEPLIQGIWYDVWRKPEIAPKKLSQGDSKKFVETRKYFGEQFEIGSCECADDGYEVLRACRKVNGVPATVTLGKKENTFSIFETPEMFGARLLSDIAERPDFYFAQREIPRTDPQIEKYERDLFKQAQIIRHIKEKELWVPNERACEVPFRCDFKDVCYSGIELGPEDMPEGFERYKRKSEEEKENGKSPTTKN